MAKVQLFQCENETQVLPTEGWIPPFGLAYIASYARNRGHEVELYSSVNGTTNKEMIQRAGNADFVGLTTTAATYHSALQIARAAKRRNPKAKIIFGGPQASALKTNVISNRGLHSRDYCVDAVCYGDGVSSFVEGVLKKRPFNEIPNLVFMSKNTIVEKRQIKEDIRNWPFIDYSFFDMERVISTYGEKFKGITPFNRGIGIMSGLGCASKQQCGFCARTDRGLRFRLPEQFWHEVSVLSKEYNVEYFFDLIDSILDSPEHLEQLVQTKPHDIDPRFRVFARSDQLTDSKNLDLLEKLGIYEVFIGFESGSRKMLEAMHKNTSPEQNLAAAKAVGERDLYIAGCFVLGVPGETKQTLEESVKHAEQIQKLSKDHLLVCGASPVNILPGSPWFARIRSEKSIAGKDDLNRTLLRQIWYSKQCPDMNPELIGQYAEKIRKASGAKMQYEKGGEKE